VLAELFVTLPLVGAEKREDARVGALSEAVDSGTTGLHQVVALHLGFAENELERLDLVVAQVEAAAHGVETEMGSRLRWWPSHRGPELTEHVRARYADAGYATESEHAKEKRDRGEPW
jgi:hypothetical protein